MGPDVLRTLAAVGGYVSFHHRSMKLVLYVIHCSSIRITGGSSQRMLLERISSPQDVKDLDAADLAASLF